MKRRTLYTLLVFLMAGIFLSACEQPVSSQVAAGQKLPEFSVLAPNGQSGIFEPPPSKLLLLNLWAVWCPPCREEMPGLQRLADDPEFDGLAIVGLAVENDPFLLEEFLHKYGIRFPNWRIAREQAETTLKLSEYPLTLLVSGDGRILARLSGAFDWDDPAIRRLILHLLQDSSQPVEKEIRRVFLNSRKAAPKTREPD